MRFTLPVLFLGGVLALPQVSLNNLPVCAQNAALTAIQSSGCPLTNVECICKSTPFVTTLRAYIEKNCSASDAQAALLFGQNTCSSAGVPFNTNAVAATAAPMPATTMVVPIVTSTLTNAGVAATATSNTAGNGTMPATYTGGAAEMLVPWTGMVAAAAVGGVLASI